MKRTLSFGLIVCLLASMAVIPVQAEEKKISVISGPFGTGSYTLSSALEDLTLKKHPWLRIDHSETPGLVYNCRKLNKDADLKKTVIHSFTKSINWLAVEGKKPFKKAYPSTMLIANYNLGSVWLASFNSELKKPADLKGKSIAIGRATQILWAIEPMWAIEHGWKMKTDMDIQYVGTKPAMTALLDGMVDAAIIGGYADPISGSIAASPQTMELIASGKKLYHLPWGKTAIQQVIDKGYPIAPITIKAGAIEGVDQDIETFVDPIAWCAYPEFPEDLAYEVTQLIIKNINEFKNYHALGKLMSPEALVYGWTPDQIHPGALKAYKEAGIIK